MERQTLTPDELAAVLGCSPSTVRRQIRATGKVAGVPAIEISPRKYVFSRAQVEQLMTATRAAS